MAHTCSMRTSNSLMSLACNSFTAVMPKSL